MENKKEPKKTYTPEFKAEAVALCEKVGITKASKDLQVALSTLHGWKTETAVNAQKRDSRNTSSKPSYEALEKECQKLKKELKYIEEINRILKKSTAIFSSSHLGVLK